MFSKRFIGFLVAPIATALSLIGPAPKAEGATTGSHFYINFDGMAGFAGSFSGFEGADGYSGASFQLTSSVHRITSTAVGMYTDPSDPSEATIMFTTYGTKNALVSEHDFSFSTQMNIGGVYLFQSTNLNFSNWNGVSTNSSYAHTQLSPFNLLWGGSNYAEYYNSITGETNFSFNATVYGSFPNDAMGLPFVGVPTPGTTATLGLAGLVALRRRRVN